MTYNGYSITGKIKSGGAGVIRNASYVIRKPEVL